MAEEVDDVGGPKGRHDAERVAVRHGHEDGSVTLGGRRVAVERPRVRATDGSGEVAMSTYAHFAERDPLTKVVLEQMLAGVSTRRFPRTREPVGQDVSTGEHLRALMARSRTVTHALHDTPAAAFGFEVGGQPRVRHEGLSVVRGRTSPRP